MFVSPVAIGGCVVGGVYPDHGTLEEIYQTIETAVRAGLNYVDTSPFYGEGKSEEVLGNALRRIPRHTYYIGTKVGRYANSWEKAFDFSEERILKEFDASLARLQLSYVDVIQIHDFEFCQNPTKIALETLPVLEKIVASGRARYIGITAFPLEEFHKVLDVTKTKVDTILTYAKNILVNSSLQDHLPYFQSKKLGVINASPTGMGLLTNAGPQPWHPASPELRELAKKAGELCEKNNVELGKISVWHSINNPGIDTTLLGFGNMNVLKLNLEVVQNGLTEIEDKLYRELQAGLFHNVDPKIGDWEGGEVEEYNRAITASRFVTTGRTVVCVGRNYVEHAKELGNSVPTEPLLFLKPVSAYIEEGSNIQLPPNSTSVHHEVELGVVIGAPLSRCTPEEAMAKIGGYTLALDMTDRQAQGEAKKKGHPWSVSKGWDTSLPVSKFLSASRHSGGVENPNELEIWCSVNGEKRQHGNTRDMIFPVADLLSFISHKFSLSPGDLVLTGTPAGVGPVLAGDVITAGLGDLVTVEFPVVA